MEINGIVLFSQNSKQWNIQTPSSIVKIVLIAFFVSIARIVRIAMNVKVALTVNLATVVLIVKI